MVIMYPDNDEEDGLYEMFDPNVAIRQAKKEEEREGGNHDNCYLCKKSDGVLSKIKSIFQKRRCANCGHVVCSKCS